MPIRTKPSAPVSRNPQSGPRTAGPGNATSDGWEDVPDEVERRSYTALIYGDTGTGRTRLALTAPGPIALAHTAEKIDGIVQYAKREGKLIRTHNFGTGGVSGSNEQIATACRPIWYKFVELWMGAVNGWARTAICDTDTEAWETIRLAWFGELNPQGRTTSLYGPVNQRWRAVFKANKADWRCNIIAVSQTKDEYEDREIIKNGKKIKESVKTGRTVRVGQREIPIMADIIIRTDKHIDPARGMVFTATIEKGWFNGDVEGMTFENEDCRLPYILSLITGIDEAEWSV